MFRAAAAVNSSIGLSVLMDNTRVSACTTIHFQPSDNFIVLAAVSGENLIESRGLSDFGALLPLPDFRTQTIARRIGGRWRGRQRRCPATRTRVLRKFARHGIWRSVCAGRTSAGLAADAGPRQHTAQPLRLAAGRARDVACTRICDQARGGWTSVGTCACTLNGMHPARHLCRSREDYSDAPKKLPFMQLKFFE